MPKADVKKDEKDLYVPPTEFTRVTVPPQWFLAIDGHGDPNVSPDYQAALQALYGGSYAVKMATKADAGARDYTVGPLEGLWWTDDPALFDQTPKARWNWTMMIRQPDWLAPARIREVLDAAAVAKKQPLIAQLRHVQLHEGDCVQIMHLGPYDDEAPTLHRLHHEYLPAHGLVENGHHHEIYLSDPRRTEPAKLRTVLRQPVSPA